MPARSRDSHTLLCRFLILLVLGFGSFHSLKATHIVGAELYYECIDASSNTYEVSLIMLRDCQNGEAEFDSPVHLFIFPTNQPWNRGVIQMALPPNTPAVEPVGWDTCLGIPYTLCVEQATYSVQVQLPPINGGYDLGWARCCRNGSITNLFLPLDQGVTFLSHVPGPDEAGINACNSSPVFNDRLPTFICVGETFSFDHSATDPDGDSLSYKMGVPFTGLNFQGAGAGTGNPGPVVTPFGNPMGAPPYQSVTYASGQYSALNPFGTGSQANIDPSTGWLTFTPAQLGIYVVAVTVEEWRNGILLSENKVDLQLHVMNCLDQGVPPVASHDFSGLDTTQAGISIAQASNDTIYAIAGTPFCYIAEVRDSVLTDQVISFPVSDVFGGGNFFPPAASFNVISTSQNPVYVEVCWSPACEYIGQTIPLIVGGKDKAGCVNTNYAYDTVYVTVLDPPVVEPQVGVDLSSTNHVGDTIILEVDSSMCFNWWVTDSLDTNHMGYQIIFQEVGGNAFSAPPTSLTRFPDSLALRTCWTAGCANLDKLYRVTLIGDDNSFCPPDNEDRRVIYIYVPPLPNPPPEVYHDLSGNIFNNDTLIVDVHDTICYTFTVKDTFPSNNVSYNFVLSDLNGVAAGSPQPVITELINVDDSIRIRVCWTPACVNINQTWMITATGTQENGCSQFAGNSDTVFVHVNNVINPPPIYTRTILPGIPNNGDTIFIAADSAVCWQFALQDTVAESYLSIDFEIQSMPSGTPSGHSLTISDSIWTSSLLSGTACFTPGCEFVNEELRIVTVARDTFDCLPANWIFDTIWVMVQQPYNNPPTITRFMGNLNLLDSITVLEPPRGEDYCFELVLEDPDSLWADLSVRGATPIFDPGFGFGNGAEITTTGTNPMTIRVCWDPSCYEQNQGFDLVVCGRDLSRCALTPEVCDSIRFEVDSCNLTNPNVFTPNGDGFNERFVPFDLQGIDYFDLSIFDRWGKRLFEGRNQGWDGKINGGTNASEGVYYYVVKLQYYSAQGEFLQENRVGWVTLLR